jgi:hypothetical protein
MGELDIQRQPIFFVSYINNIMEDIKSMENSNSENIRAKETPATFRMLARAGTECKQKRQHRSTSQE